MRQRVLGATAENVLLEEAVQVNQRALIDKILARYSTKYTLFREMIQNADDANASEVQIRFVSSPTIGSNAHQTLASVDGQKKPSKSKSRYYSGVSICNNGYVFRDEDFARIKSIADGNPDEQKIGFFGVGFYSSFSISEEPCVLSGKRAMSFHWNGDMLFVTNGSPPPSNGETGEIAELLKMVEEEWTVFDLPTRLDSGIPPKIPDMNDLAGFVLRCLSFTSNIKVIEVFIDGKKSITVGRTTSGKSEIISRPQSYPKSVHIGDIDKQFTFSEASCTTMDFGCDVYEEYPSNGETDSGTSLGLIELVRVDAWFNVNLDKDFKDSMKRITKKNPPPKVKIRLLYQTGGETIDPKSPVYSLSPAGQRGRVFIGFITQQTTGDSTHISAPFIPTMERESLDFADPVLRKWNTSLLWLVGVVKRLSHEHRCESNFRTKPEHNSNGKQLEDQNAAVNSLFSKLKSAFSISDAKSNLPREDEKRERTLAAPSKNNILDKETLKRIVVSSMATFAHCPTTPHEKIGQLSSAGFYSAFGAEYPPTVWSSMGPARANKARLADSNGLCDLIKSIPIIPSANNLCLEDENKNNENINAGDENENEEESDMIVEDENKGNNKGGGIGGFFYGLFSSVAKAAVGTSSSKRGPPGKLVLYDQFLQHIKERGIVRPLDPNDLCQELEETVLDSDSLVLLLQYMKRRTRLLAEWSSWKSKARNQIQQQKTMILPCGWCGSNIRVNLTPEDQQNLLNDYTAGVKQKESGGFFDSFTSSYERSRSQPPRRMVKCLCGKLVQIPVLKMFDSDNSDSLPNLHLESQITNLTLLKKARTKQGKLADYKVFFGHELLEKMNGCPISAKLKDMFDSTKVLSPVVSSHFQDDDLLNKLGVQWLKKMSWSFWLSTVFHGLAITGKEEVRDYEAHQINSARDRVYNLCIVLNTLSRMFPFKDAENQYVLSVLEAHACVPVQGFKLVLARNAYLGKGATGGFEALPVVQLLDSDPAKGFVVPTKETKNLLIKMGVREHINVRYIFEQFNKQTLKWSRQEILKYIADMQKSLKDHEIEDLRRVKFLPAAEFVRKGGDTLARPSVGSYNASELHLPSKELYNLGLVPLIYTPIESPCLVSPSTGDTKNDDSKKADWTAFFDEKMPPSILSLLETLGISKHPGIEVVVTGAAAERFNANCLKYILDNENNIYKGRIKSSAAGKNIIPTTAGVLVKPQECFIDEHARLLDCKCVDKSRLSAHDAEIFGVRDHPDENVIINFLARSPPLVGTAPKVFEYLSTRLPYWGDTTLTKLRNIRFIPVGENCWCKPGDVFFATGTNKKFEDLFQYVDFGSSGANRFLQICGVRSEPSPSELALELSSSGKAVAYVDRVGYESYLQLLRFIAVEWQNIGIPSKKKMARARCFLGVREKKNTDVQPKNADSDDESNIVDQSRDETHDAYDAYELVAANECFIVDSPVLRRLFHPLTVPMESQLEHMYASLGAQKLSDVVKTVTKYVKKMNRSDISKQLEDLLVSRVPLMLYQRPRNQLSSYARYWLKAFAKSRMDRDFAFVYIVPAIFKEMTFGKQIQNRNYSAFATNDIEMLITAKFDYYDVAEELVRVLLVKSDMNDALLWSSILQSSEDSLISKGFQVDRAKADFREKFLPKPKPKPKVLSQPQFAAKANDQDGVDVVNDPHGMPNSGNTPSTTANYNTTIANPSAPATPSTKKVAPSLPATNFPEKLGTNPKTASKVPGSNIDSAANKFKNSSMGRQISKGLLSKAFSKLPSPRPPPIGNPSSADSTGNGYGTGAGVPQQRQRGNTGQGLFTDSAARRNELLKGLTRCKAGGENEIKSTAQAGSKQSPEMETFMDDLDVHAHNLVKVQHLSIGGLECYVEANEDPRIFVQKAVDANVFATMLSRMATTVFNIHSSVCHLYWDSQGSTAAFNKGGALYFNFFTFSSQNWSYSEVIRNVPVKTKNGSTEFFKQPVLVGPHKAFLFWYGVLCHELSHQFISDHNASFANYQMFFMTEYFPGLNKLITHETGKPLPI